MSPESCIVCDSKITYLFNADILKKYSVKYFFCSNCGHIQTEKPYWLDEAYNNPINDSDTGILQRNLNYSNRLAPLLWKEFGKRGKYLDWAGGYGVFVRLMRDIGFDFSWSDSYTANIFAKNFEPSENDKFDLITCFEVFEHLYSPIQELESLLTKAENILISTELFDDNNIPNEDEWYYYNAKHGQHISFYSYKTLTYVAERYGMHLITNRRDLHLLSRNKLNNKSLIKLFIKIHRYLLLPFTEYVKKRMQSKTLEDSERAGN